MKQFNETPKNDTQIIKGGNKLKINRKKIILITALSVVVISILVGIVLVTTKNKKPDQSSVKTIKFEETITPNAYGNFLSTAIKGFYLGGNTNGVQIPSHGYYPSSEDIKSEEWTKANMQLDDKMIGLISKGEVVYESKGCNAEQPSSEKNKCTGFTVKSAGNVLFDSTKSE